MTGRNGQEWELPAKKLGRGAGERDAQPVRQAFWNLWTEPAADQRGKGHAQTTEQCDGAQRCLSHRRVECSRIAQVTHALPRDTTVSVPRSPWGLGSSQALPSCKCHEFLSPSETSSNLHPVHLVAHPKTTFSGREGRSCPSLASLWSRNLLPTLRTQANEDPSRPGLSAALPPKLPLRALTSGRMLLAFLSHSWITRSRRAK